MNPKRPMPKCAFCRNEFGRKPHTQSEEHILGESRVIRLGLKDYLVVSNYHHANRDEYSRSRLGRPKKAISFVQKRNICEHCNNGWMSRLEVKVDPIIIGLVESTTRINDLKRSEKELLAWWAAKTVVSSTLSIDAEDRSMPEWFPEIMYRKWELGENIRLPDGFIAFVSRRPRIDACHCIVSGSPRIYGKGEFSGEFFAGAAFYRNFMIGVAWSSNPRCPIVLVDGMHITIYPTRPQIRYTGDPLIPDATEIDLPRAYINAFVSSIGVAGDQDLMFSIYVNRRMEAVPMSSTIKALSDPEWREFFAGTFMANEAERLGKFGYILP